MQRSSHCRVLPLVIAAVLACGGCAKRQTVHAAGERMIVLGIDGMDPVFLERHWEALPHLDRLRGEGTFARLATTMPPQSPVAWSTFITGLGPAGHGIYDFVHRDPQTMSPFSSMAQAAQGGRTIPVGPFLLPLTGGEVRNLRHGTAFWKLLGERDVPATILRMPTDFPPLEGDAHSLAGMGTPDLRGTFGTFTYFTDDEQWKDRTVSGGEVFITRLQNHHAQLRIPGPLNSLRRDQRATYTAIEAYVDPTEDVARFDVGDRRVVLREGEWSRWLPVRFQLIPALASADGMVRIYVKELHPTFAVYVSPVNIDPSSPAMPVSNPESYSAELAASTGAFYTQGMPYETAALRSGVFSRADYLSQSREVSLQTIGLLTTALDDFREGFLFFHFFGIDQDSHMLWGAYENELLNTYRMVDDMVGRVRAKFPEATIVVMSDHGFASFDRAVHLNTWLMREGFLALGENGIDWTRTRAYAMGLNGIYVNQQFRERDGIVAEGEETARVLEQVRERLLRMRDPQSGKAVVSALIDSGDRVGEGAPDLLVGYTPGYRSSWETALGATGKDVIEPNRDEWRGDHCIDPKWVPGVLISNRKLDAGGARLEDLTATILNTFGVEKPAEVEGRNLFYGHTVSQNR